jgi:hypothetical protein
MSKSIVELKGKLGDMIREAERVKDRIDGLTPSVEIKLTETRKKQLQTQINEVIKYLKNISDTLRLMTI